MLCSFAQMAPTKHAATKKPTSKHVRIDFDNFKSAKADMKYNDCYKDHHGKGCVTGIT